MRVIGLLAGIAVFASAVANAAPFQIDLTSNSPLKVGAANQANSIDYNLAGLGASATALMDSLGFSGGANKYYLHATATSSNSASVTPLLNAQSTGLGVCSRTVTPCTENQDPTEVDGNGNNTNNNGADWEGVKFTLPGAPVPFDFYLVSVALDHVGTNDTFRVLFTGDAAGATSYQPSTGTCSGSANVQHCVYTFLTPGLFGSGFEFRALGSDDRWQLNGITWELANLTQPNDDDDTPTAVVPEPAITLTLGAALAGLALARRRRRD